MGWIGEELTKTYVKVNNGSYIEFGRPELYIAMPVEPEAFDGHVQNKGIAYGVLNVLLESRQCCDQFQPCMHEHLAQFLCEIITEGSSRRR